jgi:hypothetical protein
MVVAAAAKFYIIGHTLDCGGRFAVFDVAVWLDFNEERLLTCCTGLVDHVDLFLSVTFLALVAPKTPTSSRKVS